MVTPGLAITGRCDAVDITRSSVVVREHPAGWFPVFRGMFFDLDSWDGSDLFMERCDDRGGFTIFRYATAPAAQILQREKVRPLRFTPLGELEMDAVGYGIGKPHLMPADFEQRVADAYARQGVPRPGQSHLVSPLATFACRKKSAGIGLCNFHTKLIGRSPLCET